MARNSTLTRAVALLLCITLSTAGWLVPSGAVAAQTSRTAPYGVAGVDFVDGEVLVQYDSASKARAAAESNRRSAAGSSRVAASVGKSARLKVAAGTSVSEAIRSFKGQAGVVSAQPNYIYTAEEMAVTALSPNDSLFSSGYLWGLRNEGGPLPTSNAPATAGVDIGAEQAWGITTGSRDVVVAVVDTGVDYTHPDLAANMWVNPDEIPGNGIDDDPSNNPDLSQYAGSWGIDDVNGTDFYSDDGDPMDEHFHGTHVAGTIGAVGNNGTGITGVAWNVQLMALRFMGADGRGTTFDGMLSILYAADQGADVINCSWGSTLGEEGVDQSDLLLADAIEESGLLVVCAAGNGGTDSVGDDNDATPFLPASAVPSNIISVGAHTPTDTIAGFSNFGKTSVDLFAPGTLIASTVPTRTRDGQNQQVLYGMLQGTSMAAPHVAGVAALLLAEDPTLTAVQLKDIILGSVVIPDANPYSNRCVTGGRLSAASAFGLYEDELGALGGTVRRGADGQPVAGATVTVSGSLESTITAADGSFHFVDLSAGTRTLTIDATGYQRFTAAVDVAPWTTSYPFGEAGALLTLTTAASASAPPFLFSSSTLLSGSVVDGLGSAVPQGSVRIAISRDGGHTWANIRDIALGAGGQWSLPYNPSTAYETVHQVRVTYLGSEGYGTSASTAAVTPLAYLSTPTLSVSSPRAGARFTLRGYIGPRFATGVTPARAYYYKRLSNGAYTLVKSIGLRTSYYSTSRTLLSGATSLSSRGTYRVRIMYGGTVKSAAGRLLGKTYGPWRYFTIR